MSLNDEIIFLGNTFFAPSSIFRPGPSVGEKHVKRSTSVIENGGGFARSEFYNTPLPFKNLPPITSYVMFSLLSLRIIGGKCAFLFIFLQ